MQDYKNLINNRFKHLEKELQKTVRSIEKIDHKKNHSHLLKFNKAFLVLAGIGLLFGASIFLTKGFSVQHNYSISYVGQKKIQEEFESMSNIEASGGNEIQTFESNNNELKFFFYKIKQGESLYTISKKLGVSMDTLISLNSMDNAQNLGEGKRIIVPNLQGILYSVKKNDTVDTISEKFKITKEDILDANDMTDNALAENTVYEGQILFLPGAQLSEADRAKALGYLFMKPLSGRYTSGFGIRHDPFSGEPGYHPGIDIAAPIGTPVRAAKEGRVEYAGWYAGYGKCIIIKHQFGFESIYGHLSSIGIQRGSWIKQGQYIGRVGSTGYSTGAHLHLEIRKFGRPTNPLRISGLGKGRGRWY